MESLIEWLDQAEQPSREQLGGKALNLARMARRGFAVPPGFVLTTRAYHDQRRRLGMTREQSAPRLLEALQNGPVSGALKAEIRAAYRSLGASRVAVRSSATSEDAAASSQAGQQLTWLNVDSEEELFRAIQSCWASLWTGRASIYRDERGQSGGCPAMAVIVQRMVRCEVAGVAFSIDPVSGEERLIIEAAAGSGETVVGGMEEVQRILVDRGTHEPLIRPRDCPLTVGQIRAIAQSVLDLEACFGGFQDVEWGMAEGRLFLLQCRPVTTDTRGIFTDLNPGDQELWAAGFLNERFPRPVSPLGWSLMRELLDESAFRQPLRYMGCHWPADRPVTKLYRGHPYANARIYQIFYKPFPNGLLPKDARRFFPHGDVNLRRQASYPRCLMDPRFLVSVAWNLLRDWKNASPFHHHAHWKQYLAGQERVLGELRARLDACPDHNPPEEFLNLIHEAQVLSRGFLALHRWSLTHADVTYSLLQRLLEAWLSHENPATLAAQLVGGLMNKSIELNQRLAAIGDERDRRDFLAEYGHRSFSLDICVPTFADDPGQLDRLRQSGTPGEFHPKAVKNRAMALARTEHLLRAQPCGWLKLALFRWLLQLVHCYMPLREDQRFHWQRILALQRRGCLALGRRWVASKQLQQTEDIFFLKLEEVKDAVAGRFPGQREIARRRNQFARLQTDSDRAEGMDYPEFLRGNRPVWEEVARDERQLLGHPISPGIGRGRVRVVLSPEDLGAIRNGEVLVTRGADPGWTPVFGRLAALILEVGGQLSHGAVVAREYGLPAVAGIAGASRRLRDQQEVIVDGGTGRVRVLE